MMGSAVQPYEALFFFAADDIDEVNRDYGTAFDDGGFLRRETLASIVKVVAAEYDHSRHGGGEFVWVLRAGQLERLDSWRVREFR